MTNRRMLVSSAMTEQTVIPGIGVGVAFSALEAWRYPIFGPSTTAASLSLFSPNVIAMMVLALCCVFYAVVKRRLARSNIVVVAVAILASASLYCMSLSSPTGIWATAAFVAGRIHMGLSVLLFMLWMEEVLRMPDDKGMGAMAIGLVATFVIQASVIVIDKDISRTLCSLLPLCSGLCFVWHRCTAPSKLGLFARSRLRQRHQKVAAPEQNRASALIPMVLVAITCGLIFGLLNSAWRSNDASFTDPGVVQFNSALGSLLAAGALLLLKHPVRCGHLEMLIVVFALTALLMEGMPSMLPALFLIPLNIAQKLMFVLFLRSAQMFEDKPLRSLAFCSIFLAYRAGLGAQSNVKAIISNALSLDPTAATSLVVSLSCIAMVAFVIYELSTQKESAAPTAEEQESLDYYRSLAFNYYLAQKLNLTQRESDIAGLLIEEKGTPEIARELSISQSTVKTHLHNIYAKTGIHSQKEFAELVEKEYGLFFSPQATQRAGADS